MRCGDGVTEKMIDSRIEQMLENLPKHKDDEITLTFYNTIQVPQAGLFSAVAGQSKKEPWEVWSLQMRFVDISDAQVNI